MVAVVVSPPPGQLEGRSPAAVRLSFQLAHEYFVRSVPVLLPPDVRVAVQTPEGAHAVRVAPLVGMQIQRHAVQAGKRHVVLQSAVMRVVSVNVSVPPVGRAVSLPHVVTVTLKIYFLQQREEERQRRAHRTARVLAITARLPPLFPSSD